MPALPPGAIGGSGTPSLPRRIVPTSPGRAAEPNIATSQRAQDIHGHTGRPRKRGDRRALALEVPGSIRGAVDPSASPIFLFPPFEPNTSRRGSGMRASFRSAKGCLAGPGVGPTGTSRRTIWRDEPFPSPIGGKPRSARGHDGPGVRLSLGRHPPRRAAGLARAPERLRRRAAAVAGPHGELLGRRRRRGLQRCLRGAAARRAGRAPGPRRARRLAGGRRPRRGPARRAGAVGPRRGPPGQRPPRRIRHPRGRPRDGRAGARRWPRRGRLRACAPRRELGGGPRRHARKPEPALVRPDRPAGSRGRRRRLAQGGPSRGPRSHRRDLGGRGGVRPPLRRRAPHPHRRRLLPLDALPRRAGARPGGHADPLAGPHRPARLAAGGGEPPGPPARPRRHVPLGDRPPRGRRPCGVGARARDRRRAGDLRRDRPRPPRRDGGSRMVARRRPRGRGPGPRRGARPAGAGAQGRRRGRHDRDRVGRRRGRGPRRAAGARRPAARPVPHRRRRPPPLASRGGRARRGRGDALLGRAGADRRFRHPAPQPGAAELPPRARRPPARSDGRRRDHRNHGRSPGAAAPRRPRGLRRGHGGRRRARLRHRLDGAGHGAARRHPAVRGARRRPRRGPAARPDGRVRGRRRGADARPRHRRGGPADPRRAAARRADGGPRRGACLERRGDRAGGRGGVAHVGSAGARPRRGRPARPQRHARNPRGAAHRRARVERGAVPHPVRERARRHRADPGRPRPARGLRGRQRGGGSLPGPRGRRHRRARRRRRDGPGRSPERACARLRRHGRPRAIRGDDRGRRRDPHGGKRAGAARHRRRRGADADRHLARHHGPAQRRGAAPPGAEDGGHRPAHRRHRA